MHRLTARKSTPKGSKIHLLLFPHDSDNNKHGSDRVCTMSCLLLFPVAIFLPFYMVGYIMSANFGTLSVIIPYLSSSQWAQIFAGPSGVISENLTNATESLVDQTMSFNDSYYLTSHLFHASIYPQEFVSTSAMYGFGVPFFLRNFVDGENADILIEAYEVSPVFTSLQNYEPIAIGLCATIKSLYALASLLFLHQMYYSVYFPFSSLTWDRRSLIISSICTSCIFLGNLLSLGMDIKLSALINENLGAWKIEATLLPYFVMLPWLMFFLSLGHTYHMCLIVFCFDNFRNRIDDLKQRIKAGEFNNFDIITLYPQGDERFLYDLERPRTPPPIYSPTARNDEFQLTQPEQDLPLSLPTSASSTFLHDVYIEQPPPSYYWYSFHRII